MTARSVSRASLLCAILIATFGGVMKSQFADAQQQPKARVKTFYGPHDAEFPYPLFEGKMGQRDSSAMTEITQSLASSIVPEHFGLEITGTVTLGSERNQQKYPASFAIDKGRRFRLDMQNGNGNRTSRINGDYGKTKQGNAAERELEDVEFVNPLAIPVMLLEIADRKDAAVVDDGPFMLKDHSMRKVTITLFHGRFGSPVSASFYFDSNTHRLEKGVFVEHSLGNRSLENLTVMTYRDYREEQAILFPHEYSETINGQQMMSMKVESMSVTANHDTSHFSF